MLLLQVAPAVKVEVECIAGVLVADGGGKGLEKAVILAGTVKKQERMGAGAVRLIKQLCAWRNDVHKV